MPKQKTETAPSGGLKKSLRLIYVYAIAAGAIFTFIGYWDTIFYEYCGAGTFLGFILMTLLILPCLLYTSRESGSVYSRLFFLCAD